MDIDVADVRAKLKELGAVLVYPETLVRQKVFDYPDLRLNADVSWLRLREENNSIVMTFKKWVKEGIEGMREIEVMVDSFEEMERLLLAIGMKVKSSQMKKRELWKLGNVELMIDTWPWIPTFIEVEGPSEDEVRAVAGQLGFAWENAIFGGVSRIYRKYFTIEDIEIDACPDLYFSPVPEWLEKKRIVK